MNNISYQLIKNKQLTPDIFELTFTCTDKLEILAGHFIIFHLQKTWLKRAYSVVDNKDNYIVFIVKRIENWAWWSKEICELKVWSVILWTWVLGNFLLKNSNDNKLFIATWSWFAPIYYQVKTILKTNTKRKIHFIYWEKKHENLFYLEYLREFEEKYNNFTFSVYLSREENTNYNHWYVTKYLTKDNINNFQEFYICWQPPMVKDARKLLSELNIEKSKIFFEQY